MSVNKMCFSFGCFLLYFPIYCFISELPPSNTYSRGVVHLHRNHVSGQPSDAGQYLTHGRSPSVCSSFTFPLLLEQCGMDLSLVRVSWGNSVWTTGPCRDIPGSQKIAQRSAVASDTQLFFKVDTGIYTVTTA